MLLRKACPIITMVFSRRRRAARHADSVKSLTELENSICNNSLDLDIDNESVDVKSADSLLGLGMKRSGSKPSLIQFRKRNESCSSLGSNSSANSTNFGRWHKHTNPLFSTYLLNKRGKSRRRQLRKDDRISLEKENKSKSNIKRSKSRRFRRARSRRSSDHESISQDECVEGTCYTLYTKSGDAAQVNFGHDYLSIDGELVLYEHIIYWGYTKSCLKVSYVKNMSTAEQDRVDVALYPIENEEDRRLKNFKKAVKPKDLASVLQKKVASLFSELTGCSKDEALDKSSKSASKREVYDVLDQVDKTSEKFVAAGYTRDI